MMELLKNIYQITLDMIQALAEENYDEFERLLQERTETINEVDRLKAKNPEIQYSIMEKQVLKDILELNNQLTKQANEAKSTIQESMNKINSSKRLSKYQPYFKQTSGVFLDETLGKK